MGIKTGPFVAHGRMDLHVTGPLNVIEAYGPFNRELVVAGGIAQEKLDAALQCMERWGTILVFKLSALASQEALEEITRNLKRRIERGLVPAAVGLVFSADVEGGALMTPLFLKAYANAGLRVQAFSSLVEAEEWVQNAIALAEEGDVFELHA